MPDRLGVVLAAALFIAWVVFECVERERIDEEEDWCLWGDGLPPERIRR